jgi:hypothetical protein
MTSSHGHDRAETSGELELPARELREPAPERELVTILPRRITREVPIVVTAPPSTAQEAPPAITTSVAPMVLTPRPASPPQRISIAGGVVRKSGPGPLVMVLVVIASLMAGMAVYLAVHKYRHRAVVAVREDAGVVQMNLIDAEAVVAVPPRPDAAIAMAPPVDAAVRVAVIDAGVPDAAIRVATIDAGVRAVTADAGIDRNKEATLLKDQAVAALEDGDPDRALDLANQSLKLRRTAHAYLVKARALQRTGKTDDAIEAATSARDLAPGYYMTHHELGMILMSARRNADARPELEKYLELAPNDKDADTVRQLLAAPSP